MHLNYGDYIVYIDESGDHGMGRIDPGYPIFVLACCIFKKNAYINRLVPALHGFKFRHFGHDGIILHEREIRKDEGLFLSSAVLSGKSVSLKNLPRLLPGFHSPSSRQ